MENTGAPRAKKCHLSSEKGVAGTKGLEGEGLGMLTNLATVPAVTKPVNRWRRFMGPVVVPYKVTACSFT
jgi:hypothetical protein